MDSQAPDLDTITNKSLNLNKNKLHKYTQRQEM